MEIRFTGNARDFREAVWANNWARPLKTFLLKLAKLRYLYIPKRVLNQPQQDELRALIAARLPAK